MLEYGSVAGGWVLEGPFLLLEFLPAWPQS